MASSSKRDGGARKSTARSTSPRGAKSAVKQAKTTKPTVASKKSSGQAKALISLRREADPPRRARRTKPAEASVLAEAPPLAELLKESAPAPAFVPEPEPAPVALLVETPQAADDIAATEPAPVARSEEATVMDLAEPAMVVAESPSLIEKSSAVAEESVAAESFVVAEECSVVAAESFVVAEESSTVAEESVAAESFVVAEESLAVAPEAALEQEPPMLLVEADGEMTMMAAPAAEIAEPPTPDEVDFTSEVVDESEWVQAPGMEIGTDPTTTVVEDAAAPAEALLAELAELAKLTVAPPAAPEEEPAAAPIEEVVAEHSEAPAKIARLGGAGWLFAKVRSWTRRRA
jgi:hypothetical protein